MVRIESIKNEDNRTKKQNETNTTSDRLETIASRLEAIALTIARARPGNPEQIQGTEAFLPPPLAT